jgi:hypothetical protein
MVCALNVSFEIVVSLIIGISHMTPFAYPYLKHFYSPTIHKPIKVAK